MQSIGGKHDSFHLRVLQYYFTKDKLYNVFSEITL